MEAKLHKSILLFCNLPFYSYIRNINYLVCIWYRKINHNLKVTCKPIIHLKVTCKPIILDAIVNSENISLMYRELYTRLKQDIY